MNMKLAKTILIEENRIFQKSLNKMKILTKTFME
jgi:hypothetical protein